MRFLIDDLINHASVRHQQGSKCSFHLMFNQANVHLHLSACRSSLSLLTLPNCPSCLFSRISLYSCTPPPRNPQSLLPHCDRAICVLHAARPPDLICLVKSAIFAGRRAMSINLKLWLRIIMLPLKPCNCVILCAATIYLNIGIRICYTVTDIR